MRINIYKNKHNYNKKSFEVKTCCNIKQEFRNENQPYLDKQSLPFEYW